MKDRSFAYPPPWPILGESDWPVLGENGWPLFGESLWPIFTRKMTTVAEDFLEQTAETDPQTLFAAYAEHLLDSAAAWELPVPLEKIRERHGFRLRTTSLKQRGFLLGKTIFINDDDATTVQRFTEAHEFMEALTIVLRNEVPSRLEAETIRSFEVEKESWCEQGAATLLLPKRLFFPTVEKVGISLRSARRLAERCKTSLTATMRRMLDTDLAVMQICFCK